MSYEMQFLVLAIFGLFGYINSKIWGINIGDAVGTIVAAIIGERE